MNKQQLEQNIKTIVSFNNEIQKSLHGIYDSVKNEGPDRRTLNDFLEYIGLENNEETRFIAYERVVSLREEPIILYLKNNPSLTPSSNQETETEKIDKIIDLSYDFTADFHLEIQSIIISYIEREKLLTPFYLEIFKGVTNVGIAFNELFLPWRNYIVKGINKGLEKKFKNDSLKIMNYLNDNNLFDKGYDGDVADRSYTALVEENGKYKSKAYSEVFEVEVNSIVEQLDIFIEKLSNLKDEIYEAKSYYIEYLSAIKNAFIEKNTDKLLEKWAIVDEKWMQIKTPFQIGHPLEFYEDQYRKAVAPEWDLRILNPVFETEVESSILNMYESIFDKFDKNEYKSAYNFSLTNQKRVQLYISTPILYFSSELTGLFSAQVVPNDEKVSEKFGKKIFAYPEMVLDKKRSEPFMKLATKTIEANVLDKYRISLFSKNELFYKIYDIETIGHEYGHTLWLDMDSESVMNKKTGIFKNIEEFKATTGGLVAYFLKKDNQKKIKNLDELLIIHHIIRCVGLLKYREVNEVIPYYCESLIHLDIIFESNIVKINIDNQIELNFNEENYNNFKKVYIKHYKKLIKIYLNKIDAGEFLMDYVIKSGTVYLPKNKKIRDFVEYCYDLYKKVGNDIDESISKDKYNK